VSATNRGERGEGSVEEVLAGRARWCVVEGDCLQVLPTFPEKSVDHVISDPPYSEWVHAKVRRGGSVHAPDVVAEGRPLRATISTSTVLGFDSLTAETRAAVGAEAARLCRRWALAFSDTEATHLWRESFEAAGLQHVRDGFWIKLGATPQFTGDRPASGAEGIEIAHPPGRKRWNGGGTHAVWAHPIVPGASEERAGHTTQKPVSLMLELVELFTDPGEVVLDPFAGSGTTGVACLRLGRRVILIEKSEKYAALARERMRAEEQGLTLRDARAGQLPLLAGV
jgi:hypothetical protein